jgi:hypothetical protein
MKYQPTITLAELPSAEQLAAFRVMHAALRYGSSGISSEQKKAFCALLLSLDPFLIEPDDIELVKKNCPQLWEDYCNWHWGTKEEQQHLEQEKLLACGYIREEDGTLYNPNHAMP